MLHSDRELEMEECLKIGYEFEKSTGLISKEYLNLFNKITEDDLSPEERIHFNNIRECEYILSRVKAEKDTNEAYRLLDIAEKLNPRNPEIYYLRGHLYFDNGILIEAISQYNRIIDLEKPSLRGLYARAASYFNLKKYELALKDLEEASNYFDLFEIDCRLISIKVKLRYPSDEILKGLDTLIEKYPDESNAYNERSNYFRKLAEYDKALVDIYKALELDTENGLAYSTLSEIKACQKEFQEFYRNFELALKYKFDSNQIVEEEVLPIYFPFFKEDRFIKLLEKYNRFDTIEKIMKLNSKEE